MFKSPKEVGGYQIDDCSLGMYLHVKSLLKDKEYIICELYNSLFFHDTHNTRTPISIYITNYCNIYCNVHHWPARRAKRNGENECIVWSGSEHNIHIREEIIPLLINHDFMEKFKYSDYEKWEEEQKTIFPQKNSQTYGDIFETKITPSHFALSTSNLIYAVVKFIQEQEKNIIQNNIIQNNNIPIAQPIHPITANILPTPMLSRADSIY